MVGLRTIWRLDPEVSIFWLGGVKEPLIRRAWSGSLLQKLNRDTQKCAYKCSAIEVNGELRQVYKDPVTDKGKKSKKGLLTLQETATGFETVMEGKGDASKVGLCNVWWLVR